MRICVILEGCYPYVTGGVSSWIHQYIQAMPQHEFVVWAIGASSDSQGQFKYTLPDNVVEVKEIFLGDALKLVNAPQKYNFTPEETQVLYDLINCKNPHWEVLFEMYAQKRIAPVSFLQSETFLDILMHLCETEYPYTAFSDLFHTIRSMFLPVLHLLSSEIPKADVYHAIATGYSGILARLGSYTYHVPYLITEHGIYTREREEEIIRAKWVNPAFKKFWVRFFYMLSDGAYEKASMITSLFSGAMHTQIDMGCDPDKCTYIGNGIHYERFCKIPPKPDNGYVDIGAVLRIAPIKDVKTMIYAFADLKARVPNARLYIAGPEDDKEYAQECYDLIAQLQVPDITFLGTVNVTEWLGKFDFTMLSSISEGMPLSVLESFAAGCPVITTDVGCCKELINKVAEDDDLGSAGYCVPPIHVQAMSDAMARMCQHPVERRKMGIIGRKRVEKYFLHEDMIRRYLEVYDEVFKRWQESDSV
ncbi:GT4 family glycosyltransferase PelF [Oscillibacter valericigenes]|uniref:GT4 family glycosyltransferase PelF n=1 Tax=Oscillibacter valericigenes TaxID=351091 RepID=UPI001F227599|nr:GT4 family glycosyltransferase PelF [Oscillibacter valericigenes]MCF2616394.1 GT4 family glycosyltransferase PelF [Oscillibacter valericigenes]